MFKNSQILLVLLAIFTTLPNTYSQNYTWVLKWSDEFNGPTLNSSNWNYKIGNNNGWGNKELEYYTNSPQNSYISDGNLVIQALKESYKGYEYTSARITTQGKFSVKYGKFEISAKLPYGQGIWPAFWLLGDDITSVGWPACGEIDIMEYIGKAPHNIYSSMHAPGYSFSQPYTYSGSFSDEYHTYTVDWQPDSVSFYFDEILFETHYPSQAHGKPWPFDQNFFILLNLAIGGDWPGSPNSSTVFPQKFIIDYVRVWERCYTCI